MIEIKRALISCWNKDGLDDLANDLVAKGVEIVSSGGTATYLQDVGIPVTRVEDVTGYPEVLGGRVKTLHPRIHAAILAKNSEDHLSDLDKIETSPIQLVVVNLYPFVDEAIERQLDIDEAVEFIDIGGPTLLRAAAKNHAYTIALHNPAQYAEFREQFSQNNGAVEPAYSRNQARAVFFYTSWYDGQIQAYLGQLSDDASRYDTLHLEKKQSLRYGENPHQAASAYVPFNSETGMAGLKQLWGKELSFNNYVDVHAAYALALDLDDHAVAIIKHTNPCGAATSPTSLAEAFDKALRGDSLSAFGGIVACNKPIDVDIAEKISKIFFECVIAPGFETAANDLLTKKKNLRLLEADPQSFSAHSSEWKALSGIYLQQDADNMAEDPARWRVVTESQPTAEQSKELAFAWKLVKHIKSNAIVLTKDMEIYGVGAGQMSRVDSVQIARMKAQNADRDTTGTIMASDAFFPFRDGIDNAAEAGVKIILQPGGSIRDEEVIAAANEHGICMVFTGVRHFKH